MAIIKTKLEKGFSVKFPFELKDSFRGTFKTAKWNPCEKVWVVGPRSEKRLDQWISESEALCAEFEKAKEENDSHALTENELIVVKHELAQFKLKIEELNKTNERLTESRLLISSIREEIKIAKAEFDEKTKIQKEHQAILQAEFDKVCDLRTILDAQSDMQSAYNKIGAIHRRKYKTAQETIIEQHDRLEKVSMRSLGLAELGAMSFNRPDRDVPRDITLSQILTFRKYE